MPITINLLHEQQEQAKARLRDPLKVVQRVAFAVVGILVLAVVLLWFLKNQATTERKRIASEWASVEKEAARITELRDKLQDTYNKVLAYTTYAAGRMLWGSQLEMLKNVVPSDVYLVEITSAKVKVPAKTVRAKAVSARKDKAGSTAPAPDVAGEPDVEVTVLILRGRVRGENFSDYSKGVEAFLNVLRTDPKFSAQFTDPKNDITQKGDIQEATVGRTSRKEGEFVIHCQLPSRGAR